MSNDPLSQTVLSHKTWLEPDWNGPVIETRPTSAEASEWPEGAVERVVFTLEQFPDSPFPEELPYVEHFGADGWPLQTPESVKSRLDLRMQTEVRRWPWTMRPEAWKEQNWLRFASSYDDFLLREAEAAIIRQLAPMLPKP